tara:strand:+ start:368 stop:562 length:195 start_codon:yes stop_codon:yes gene_type:complete
MSSSDSFLEVAKSIQDTYMGGSLQGQLYALEQLKSHIEFQIKDVQARIDETPTGKVLNNLTQSK